MIPLFETMDEAIDAAAEHLPQGYSINIMVERHGYGVCLLNRDSGEETELDGGDGMLSDVYEGIEQARELDK